MARYPGPPEEPKDVIRDAIETASDAAAASGTPGTAIPPQRRRVPGLIGVSARSRALWLIVASLGPGLVAANAGNDAGGIATYASDGSSFGYSVLWMFPLILLSLAIVQEMAARMGAATGKGLSDLIRENFGIHATFFVLLALLIANGGTVISEFVGIGAAIDLVVPHAKIVLLPLITFGIWFMVVRGSYSSVEKVFLVMTLVFFAYPISAVLAHPDWGLAARSTVVPSVHFSGNFLLLFVATIGTSITPYMQVYVQSAVAEKGITPRDYKHERYEVYLASLFANLIAIFIVIATAATIYKVHPRALNTAADAALALRPLAGRYAEYLFAVGLFGASMLAAAVLPLATAFSITEALGFEKGVGRHPREAPVFTGIFTALMAIGCAVALIPTLPVIQVLLVVQVLDCVLLPFILFSILRLINNRRLMGTMVNGPVYNTIAWVTAVVVTVLSLSYVGISVLQIFGVNL